MAATIGRYEVVRPLGQGGMGAVFLGWDPSLERQVALKLLRSELAHSALRDLDALHRTDDAAALCHDSLEPPLFRPAFLALRRACGG